MKKLLIFLFAAMLISCNNNPVIETPHRNIQTDTSKLQIDTVRVITMKRLTASNLYGLHCKICHGNDGKGTGVKSRTSKGIICPYDLTKIRKPDKEIYYIVLNGENKMPNQHELDSNNIWVIVIYIKKFKDNEK
jgi:cytochrome c5